MVTITGYEKKETEDKEFYLLLLEGDVEIVFSQETGMPYATVRKTKMSTTFSETTCKKLIGKQFPGSIAKMEVEPYEYTIPETGETRTLTHKYVYSSMENQTSEQAVFNEAVAV